MTPRVQAFLTQYLLPPPPRTDRGWRTHAVPWEINRIEASPWYDVGGRGGPILQQMVTRWPWMLPGGPPVS